MTDLCNLRYDSKKIRQMYYLSETQNRTKIFPELDAEGRAAHALYRRKSTTHRLRRYC